MGKIVLIMGKSSSGKDTVYNRIKDDPELNLNPIVPYTTRPIRDGETEGKQYHFVSAEEFGRLKSCGEVVEYRVYNTVHGDWIYFTVNEGIDLKNSSYIAIGTLESYEAFKEYFREENLIPVYIEVDDGVRLQRALNRELKSNNRKFKEMCRRFIADCDDFSEEKIAAAGIGEGSRIENTEIEDTVSSVKQLIKRSM